MGRKEAKRKGENMGGRKGRGREAGRVKEGEKKGGEGTCVPELV